ncbi:MAG: Phosphotransferase enzyme family, partial [Symbiobacteriaceae bacterium]|nr:Phosphotransferase enzyme family [Symbiobacteriaceae bacterium]
LLLEALPENFPDFSAPNDVAACYRHLANVHTRFIHASRVTNSSLEQTASWAVDQAEIARVLSAFPESRPFAEHAGLLTEGPTTLIHGDYHRWTLILGHDRVRVLDWEHAGLAHPIWDLVLLAPEEPGWDGVPRGALATLALQRYYEAGPLARLTWSDFRFRQRLARLFVAARWTLTHRTKAAAQPPGGLRDQVLAHANAEHARVKALSALLAHA